MGSNYHDNKVQVLNNMVFPSYSLCIVVSNLRVTLIISLNSPIPNIFLHPVPTLEGHILNCIVDSLCSISYIFILGKLPKVRCVHVLDAPI